MERYQAKQSPIYPDWFVVIDTTTKQEVIRSGTASEAAAQTAAEKLNRMYELALTH